LALSTFSTYISNAEKNEKLGLIDMSEKLCESGKVPFIFNRNAGVGLLNPIYKFNSYGGFALHFDASKLAILLKTIAQERGIKRVEGVVKSIEQDSTGDIKKVELESNIFKYVLRTAEVSVCNSDSIICCIDVDINTSSAY
jgi:hypothetical protein